MRLVCENEGRQEGSYVSIQAQQTQAHTAHSPQSYRERERERETKGVCVCVTAQTAHSPQSYRE